MTISYDEDFSSLMFRWRGSLWKAVLKDMIWFYAAYFVILTIQYYMLDEKQKEYFTGWILWCEIGSQYIPLSFLLGFFVAMVVARWWEQFNWISWPDKFMMTVSACLPGKEHLDARKTIARWTSLQSAIAWTGISVRTLKRFPTERHLVESRLMTEEEYDLYTSMNAPHGKWFIPIMWILNLLKQKYREKIIDSVQFEMLIRQLYAFRDGFAMLYVYDWVKVPLVYTQVVAIATYGYFFICLIGRQPKLDQKSMQSEICILFPIFTTFQIFFYIGWLKVGQYLMNPFGEDDDDFELNYILDRNTCIAHMLASELADQLPSQHEHHLADALLPHTRASFKIQDIIPKGHLQSFVLTKRDMQLIHAEELEKQEEDMAHMVQQLQQHPAPNRRLKDSLLTRLSGMVEGHLHGAAAGANPRSNDLRQNSTPEDGEELLEVQEKKAPRGSARKVRKIATAAATQPTTSTSARTRNTMKRQLEILAEEDPESAAVAKRILLDDE